MAEAQQQSRSTQPQGQQPSGQALQGMPRRGDGEQTGLARRGSGMPSLFHMDPFDMFRTSPFALMRRFMEDIEQQWGQPGWAVAVQAWLRQAVSSFLRP